MIASEGRPSGLERIRSGLVVSCQAGPGHPMRHRSSIVALAECARDGGAHGLRVDGIDSVRAVRERIDLPVIAIKKQFRPGRRPFITPTFEDCAELVDAGADVVAVEATAESPTID